MYMLGRYILKLVLISPHPTPRCLDLRKRDRFGLCFISCTLGSPCHSLSGHEDAVAPFRFRFLHPMLSPGLCTGIFRPEWRCGILPGGIVIRTHDGPPSPYIPLFLHTTLGPDYYVPPVSYTHLTLPTIYSV